MKAIPTTYQGVTYRSRLEASWAKTLDGLSIGHAYEPRGYQVGDYWYLPDFELVALRTVCEVKGSHDERLDKAVTLAKERAEGWQRTVLLRPPNGGHACWSGLLGEDFAIRRCDACDGYDFVDLSGDWRCARCWADTKISHCMYYVSADQTNWPGPRLPFETAEITVAGAA